MKLTIYIITIILKDYTLLLLIKYMPHWLYRYLTIVSQVYLPDHYPYKNIKPQGN